MLKNMRTKITKTAIVMLVLILSFVTFSAVENPATVSNGRLTIHVARIYKNNSKSQMYLAGSLDATVENWLQSTVMKIKILCDNNPEPVFSGSIPIENFKFANKKLTYESDTPIAYVQLNAVNKTFVIIGVKDELASDFKTATLEIALTNYLGRCTKQIAR